MYVSILLVRALLSELRRRNLPDRALLDRGPIDAGLLADPRATIELVQWEALLLRAAEVTRDPAVGLALGEHWSQSMLQIVGQLVVSCRTMRDALEMFERYRPLLANNAAWKLEEDGDRAYLYMSSRQADSVASRIGIEAVLAVTYRIGQGFVPVRDRASDEVWFCHAAPDYASEYARVFPGTVRFEQPYNALVFERRYLDLVQPHGDDTLRGVLSDSADLLLRERETESVAERVRAILRYQVDLTRVDARQIAAQLNMNVRALRRRLGAERAPLSRLLDEALLHAAQRELRRPEVSIKEVAHDLGFSEPSAFHRAFKRWSGQTPAQYIREALARQASPDSDLSDA